jgi:hypothetical protein
VFAGVALANSTRGKVIRPMAVCMVARNLAYILEPFRHAVLGWTAVHARLDFDTPHSKRFVLPVTAVAAALLDRFATGAAAATNRTVGGRAGRRASMSLLQLCGASAPN